MFTKHGHTCLCSPCSYKMFTTENNRESDGMNLLMLQKKRITKTKFDDQIARQKWQTQTQKRENCQQ